MKEKKCKTCNQLKKINEFKSKYCYIQKKYYLKNNCEICEKLKRQKYNLINAEKIKEQKRIYYLNNKERLNFYNKIYREKNFKAISERKKIYYSKPENIINRNKKFNKYWKKRYNENPEFKFNHDMRVLINNAIKRTQFKKKNKTVEILGCSIKEFNKHIKDKFYLKMNWNNRSEWHIDHIIPLKAAKTEFEVVALNHYTNLQPLWAKDNLTKGDSFNKEDFDNYMSWYIKNVRTEEEYNSLTL